MTVRDKTTDTTDDKVDLYTVFGGFVEAVYHGRVLEGVHF
jgi:hypothetical protein